MSATILKYFIKHTHTHTHTHLAKVPELPREKVDHALPASYWTREADFTFDDTTTRKELNAWMMKVRYADYIFLGKINILLMKPFCVCWSNVLLEGRKVFFISRGSFRTKNLFAYKGLFCLKADKNLFCSRPDKKLFLLN